LSFGKVMNLGLIKGMSTNFMIITGTTLFFSHKIV